MIQGIFESRSKSGNQMCSLCHHHLPLLLDLIVVPLFSPRLHLLVLLVHCVQDSRKESLLKTQQQDRRLHRVFQTGDCLCSVNENTDVSLLVSMFLADPGEARGGSTNTSVIH